MYKKANIENAGKENLILISRSTSSKEYHKEFFCVAGIHTYFKKKICVFHSPKIDNKNASDKNFHSIGSKSLVAADSVSG